MMRKVVVGLMCLATVLSFAGCFGNSYDTDFTISRMTYFADNKEKSLVAKLAIQIDDSEKKFNYFGIVSEDIIHNLAGNKDKGY